MKVTQVAEILNNIWKETTGEEVIFTEDLSNIVEVGSDFLAKVGVDNYVKSVVNKVGHTRFLNREYEGIMPSMYMDSWEYGSIMETIFVRSFEFEENESWELQNNSTYEQDIFKKPTVDSKYYNGRVTFEVPCSFTDLQIRESFTSASKQTAFFGYVELAIRNTLTSAKNNLAMRTMNNMIADTVHSDYSSGNYGASSGRKAVNLLYLYNLTVDTPITANDCMTNKDFIRFASKTIMDYINKFKVFSKAYNIEGVENFTPSSDVKLTLLSEFSTSAKTYLYSDTFNKDDVKIPTADEVPYWQGEGINDNFTDHSTVNVKTATNNTVNVSGVLGVLRDNWSLGISNLNERVTTHYNAKGEFWNNFYKIDCGYYNMYSQNFVVFFVA